MFVLRRELHDNFLSLDLLQLVRFDFLVKRNFQHFPVFDVVIALGVILENCRVAGNDLKLVTVFGLCAFLL